MTAAGIATPVAYVLTPDIWHLISENLSFGQVADVRLVCRDSSTCTVALDELELSIGAEAIEEVTANDPHCYGLATFIRRAFVESLRSCSRNTEHPVPRAVWAALNWMAPLPEALSDCGRQVRIDLMPELATCDCARCFETLACGRGKRSALSAATGNYLHYKAGVGLPPYGDGTPWGPTSPRTPRWTDADRWPAALPASELMQLLELADSDMIDVATYREMPAD